MTYYLILELIVEITLILLEIYNRYPLIKKFVEIPLDRIRMYECHNFLLLFVTFRSLCKKKKIIIGYSNTPSIVLILI